MAEVAILMARLGWVASPVLTKLVNKGISYLGNDISKGLEDLETTLLPQIQLTIQAAQQRPPSDIAPLANWLVRLKNAYYDAEGILHELEYERLKCNAKCIIHKSEDKKMLVRLSSKPIIKPLAKFIARVRFSCKPIIKPLAKYAVIKSSLLLPQKIKLLQRLNVLKEVAAEAKTFRELLSIQSTESIQNVGNDTLVTSPLLGKGDKVFGRDGEINEIIKFLLDEQGGSSLTSYSVVAVTGMGGAGKTTLAQYVYNNEKVKKYFGVRIWLCLSQNLDVTKHTKEMIECASQKECPNLLNFGQLQEKLLETLSESDNILIILDDVWYDNNDGATREKQWEDLLKPFDSQRGTCKIVVTSRSSWLFPNAIQPGKFIELRDLEHEDFISLLRYHAIDGLEINNSQLENDLSDMHDILDQIAEKMSKSPLAAKVVGNQLRKRPNITFWCDTLKNVKCLNDTMEILLWSFHRFNVQLQRCFLFCSVFPKGTRFNVLVPYWVALDFIQSSDNNINVEDIGREYFEIMVANSIFHLVDGRYMMHDLFHDLAEKLSAGYCFKVTNVGEEIPSTVQHVYLQVNNENLKENLSRICHLSNLHTLILKNPFIDDISEIISKISINFRNLRVLIVHSEGYKTLPRVVGDFRNLRLLKFNASSIEELPDSFVQLYHLQFLYLPSSIKALPTKLSSLIKLRHLEMGSSDGDQFSTLPPVPYLGRLTSLQRLNAFHVRKEEGYELHQLGCLKEIGGSLRIVNIENIRSKDEAVAAKLIDKPKLKKLELVWAESGEINVLEMEIVEALRPPKNLECLTINGYMGSTYPTWLQDGSFIKNIKEVRFYNCNALTFLFPSVHQFRHCSKLVLKSLGALKELSSFPESLAMLTIIKCPSLIFVHENEVQVNVQGIREHYFLGVGLHQGLKGILDQDLKSLKKTCSVENCAEQLQILDSAARGNAPECSKDVNRAWWYCHQQRMKYIFRYNSRALKLPSKLRILYLHYCCVSDGALSDCLRGIDTLEELYLEGIMTITTLPPSQILKSLQSLRVLEMEHCWYLNSFGGLIALPNLERFLVQRCWCWEMYYLYTPLPPTLQSFILRSCAVPMGIFDGYHPCLQNVELNDCVLSEDSLSLCKLTNLKSLIIRSCGLPDHFTIEGLESRPFINTLELAQLPELDVESVLKSWQGCQELFISSSAMLNRLLSSQNFDPPRYLCIKYCEEEAISIDKSDHLQSIKILEFYRCKTKNLPETLNDFSTLEYIFFKECPEISGLPELPRSVLGINIIRGCKVLRERCQPYGADWHKIQWIQYRWIE